MQAELVDTDERQEDEPGGRSDDIDGESDIR